MDVLQFLLIGLFLSIALAVLSGSVYLLVSEKKDRALMRGEGKEGHRCYVEVWQCPNCNQLSRIARRCKWCMKEIPGTPKFLTVPEREYTEQILLSRTEPRRNPPGNQHLPGIHP
jgi:hypothetical protein